MHDSLISAVQMQRDAMAELTRKLVAIPTENPPGQCYPRAIQFLRQRLVDLEFEDVQLVGDCVLAFVGQGERTLYFSGHYDVVPAQSPGQFEPRIEGANLFGRGSSDMKGGLAAMIYAAKALRDSGARLNGRVGLVFVPDEETAGARGSRYLADHGVLGRNAIGMLTPEPTGGIVWNANRGAITMKVTVRGKSAHVGRQFEGWNAFEQMLTVVAPALLKLKAEVETRVTAFQIVPDAARHSILMLGGQVGAGTNFNVVPEICWFTIDRRMNPEEDFAIEKRRLLSVLNEARDAGVDLEIDILQEGASSGVPEDGPLGIALGRSIRQITGRSPQFEMCPGLLEIRFYAESGIPAFAYGPGLLDVSHGPNEYVPIDRIVECAAVYALTTAELLADPLIARRDSEAGVHD